MNINPFIELVSSVIYLLKFSLMAYIIIEWLVAFQLLNAYHPFVRRINELLSRVFDPALNYIRTFIKPIAGIDLSPIVLFLVLNFTDSVLFTYFYKI